MPLGQDLAPHLPFLRRYARALTGSQSGGDAFVTATLEAIVAAPREFPSDVDPRVGLYRTFHAIWSSANIEEDPGATMEGEAGVAQKRLARITPLSRQALLLTAMEGFTPEDAGYVIGAASDDVERLVAEALAEIERQTRAEVLIIEAPIRKPASSGVKPSIAVRSSAWRDSGVIRASRAWAIPSAFSAPAAPGSSSILADDQMAWKVR